MKILEINSVCGIRSTGRICTDIADTLNSSGHSCKVAYGRENAPERYNGISYRIGSSASVKIDALKTRFFDNAGFNSKSETKKFIRWAKEWNPEIVHLHNLHGYFVNVEELFEYLRESQKKVVWTLHDCWAFTGHCSHFASAGCEKWKDMCYACPKKKAYPSSLFLDNSQRNFKRKKELFTSLPNVTIVTPSQWLADLVSQSFMGKYPIKVINNGIDTTVFKPTYGDFRDRYGLRDKKIVLGVASAWGTGKGLFDFYRLAKLLDESYKVVLVGLSDEQKRDLPSEIIGITRTNNAKELAEIYTTSDVFVNPTYCDTYPTVNLEAQACGTPVITYRTGGSVESVWEDCIVEQGDVEGLKDKIVSGEFSCKEDISFDKSEMIRKYIEVYKQNG